MTSKFSKSQSGMDSTEPKLTQLNLNHSDTEPIATIRIGTLNGKQPQNTKEKPIALDEKTNFARFQKTLQDGNTTFWSKSMQEKAEAMQSLAATAIGSITVEPCVLLYILGFAMSGIVAQNLILEKYCLTYFSYPEEVCDTLKQNETLENQVQTLATNFQLYKTFIETLPTVLISLFLGTWSDKNGRKVLMLLPTVGSFLNAMVYIVNAYFMHELRPGYLLIAEVPAGIFGGKAAMTLGAFSYIIDTTTVQSRTIRIAVLQAALMCGGPIGLALGGIIYSQLGYIPVFAASACINIISFMYILFVVKDTIVPETKPSFCQKICSFFNVTNIKNGIHAVLKKREFNHRVHIICLIIALMINVLPTMVELTISYYYFRVKFYWGVDIYSYYITITLICNMIGLLLFLPLFTKLKVSEAYIGIIGACAKVCSELLLAFTPRGKGWIVFAASPILVFGGLNSPIVRSLLSKCISPHEQGKVMSIVTALEACMPLLGSAVYTQVFNATRTTFPGTFYLISAVLCVIPAALLVWIFRDIKKQQRSSNAPPSPPASSEISSTVNSPDKEEMYDVHL